MQDPHGHQIFHKSAGEKSKKFRQNLTNKLTNSNFDHIKTMITKQSPKELFMKKPLNTN